MMAKPPHPQAAMPGPDDRVHSPAKLVAVLDALAAEGIAAQAALAGTALARPALDAPRTRVSLTEILTVFGNALRLSANPAFAFEVGSNIHVSTYGMYGFAILSSTNFRQTARFVTTYHQLAAPSTEVTFEESGGVATWTIEPVTHRLVDAGLYRFIVEMQFGLQTSLHRDIMGPGFAFEEAQVTWTKPSDRYAEAVGTKVLFAQPANRFLFRAGWLDAAAVHGNALAYADVVELCDGLLREIGMGVGTAGQVRHLLLANLMRPMALQDIAAALGVSERTLRRRLAAQETSFRDLLDELRRDLALRSLADETRTVEEIAFALGFSDAANFRHAFRRWTDAAPRQFRAGAARIFGIAAE